MGEKLKGCGAYIEPAYREFMLDGRNKENAGISGSGSGSENNAEKNKVCWKKRRSVTDATGSSYQRRRCIFDFG